ncbi:MAG: GNAT family N-acetyltransferase [Gemmataceae bacterium]
MISPRIEPGRPDVARDAARLICTTDVALYRLLSAGRPDVAEDFVAGQWRRDGCLFSHRFALVARGAAGVCGVVLSYTAEQHNSLPQSHEPWPAPPGEEPEVRRRALAMREFLFPTVPAGALYVQNLAVAEAARGAGLGRALLEEAVAAGRRAGCNSCHLDVAADNHAAVALYLRAGLEVLVETRVPPLIELAGIPAHLRFVRPIRP